MSDPIRVFIADDHAIVREGLRSLLETRPDMVMVGEASDGAEAVARVQGLQPDVILLDMVMPGKDGLQAIREIKEQNSDARILVLTSFAEDDKLFPAMKAGALGYLLKDSSPQELLQAIRNVYQGNVSLHPLIALKVVQELNRPPTTAGAEPEQQVLTARELEVLRLIAHGLTNPEIAERLVITERTVAAHVSTILSKLHLANRTQAAVYAFRNRLATVEDEGPAGPTS